MQDVSIPLPSTREEIDQVLVSFEGYFTALQKKHGFAADKLTTPERAIIAAFIVWLRDHSDHGELAYAHHQAG